MDYKEIERLIPKFIKQECSEIEEEEILAHMRKCPECKEELTIQLLLQEGLNRLESGDSFDLNAELEERLNQTSTKKKQRKQINPEVVKIITDVISGIVVLVVVIGLLIWKIH